MIVGVTKIAGKYKAVTLGEKPLKQKLNPNYGRVRNDEPKESPKKEAVDTVTISKEVEKKTVEVVAAAAEPVTPVMVETNTKKRGRK